ncbi:MAG: DUF4139 domain-containing protein [Magnetospirillum sp. WYHS-4]
MRHFLFAALLGAVSLDALAAGPPEKVVPVADRSRLALTIYNNDLALVRDRRRVALPKGESALAFEGVAAHLIPETAFLAPVDGEAGMAVLDQAFDAKLISPPALLEASLGREVGLIQTHPATGQETVVRARVLAVAGGLVLQMPDGKLRTGDPAALLFDGLPPGLRAQPTLVSRIDAAAAAARDIELRYLTGGIKWRADYQAEIAPSGDRLVLEAWATMTNASGADLPEAAVKLVAGEVARGPQAPPQPRLMSKAAMAEGAVTDGVSEESLSGYHLYTIARPVTLLDGQTRQVSLLAAPAVKAKLERVSEGTPYVYRDSARGDRDDHAALSLVFDNGERDGLGLPLPAGTLRLYRRDAAQDLQFVGADRLGHTAKGETVRLRVGKDSDLPVRRLQTEFNRVADRLAESAYRITATNGGKEAVEVRIAEPIPGDWQMLEESHPHRKASAGRAEWVLAIPPGGKIELAYRVRVRM